MKDASSATEKLAEVNARIKRAGAQVGRDTSGTTLIAVAKTFSAEAIVPVLASGHRHFGENRVQEAMEKWPTLKRNFPGVVLHLIGTLQSNKVRDALEIFDAIHSLDRDSLAEALAREISKSGIGPTLFVQVNSGLEPQKSGVAPRDAPEFVHRLRTVHELSPQGLMCIPPEADDPGPHFAMLRQIAKDCGLPLLSMGMSGDFEIAVKLGATHVRVGSAIFGDRHFVSSM
jgi:pyridoxal phosphate enzyme (YggS family)